MTVRCGLVVFLLSDRSGVVTGSVIDWDQAVVGGSTAWPRRPTPTVSRWARVRSRTAPPGPGRAAGPAVPLGRRQRVQQTRPRGLRCWRAQL